MEAKDFYIKLLSEFDVLATGQSVIKWIEKVDLVYDLSAGWKEWTESFHYD